MGNTYSESECVSLADKFIVTEAVYTVLRSSGAKDEGWVISKPIPGADAPRWVNQHAMKMDGVWRIFMHNNQTNPNLFACGWRRIDTIHPTQLMSQDAIENWRKCLLGILEDLEANRLQANRLEANRLEAQSDRQKDTSGNLMSF